MKILLSAYACEPGKGSEPGIGWNWALNLAELHEVWVITRSNNKNTIEQGLQCIENVDTLHFIYCDLPRILSFWKKLPGGIYFYYSLWQLIAFFSARQQHRKISFDIVHHITFGSFRQSSFMGCLGIPFFFGPVGGGESCPFELRSTYPISGKIVDLMRDIANATSKLNPLLWLTFIKAHKIFTKTEHTKSVIPHYFHHKTEIARDIGIESAMQIPKQIEAKKLLFVGRHIYWKGGHIALLAFHKATQAQPDLELSFAGSGKEERHWKALAEQLNISDKVHWLGQCTKSELDAIYANHHAFLFPSLRDSSGTVLFEAMAHGLPVLCLDLGGPGSIITPECGIKISCKNITAEEIINRLADAIFTISTDSDTFHKLCCGAQQRISSLSWRNAISDVYKFASL